MEHFTAGLSAIITLNLLISQPATAQDKAELLTTPDSKQTVTPPPQTTGSQVPYIPPAPARPTPLIRVATGGTRGNNQEFPRVTLLVPDHVARTLREQPSVFWYISRPTQQPTVLTLSINDQVNPLLELKLDSPVQAGIHEVKFSDHKVRLVPGKTYEWSVSINEITDRPASGDLVARGFIERIAPNDEAQSAEQNDLLKQAQIYAQNGIWYDALSVSSQTVYDRQLQEKLREHRKMLLKQVGLDLDIP